MNSQLNPEAAVFIPPTRLLMMDNAIISASAGVELNEPPATLPFPSGPKHVDYFMRDNFSTLPNKMKSTSACTEQMEHIPLDKLLAVENINQDIPVELQRACFFGMNKDFDAKESCIIDISENSDIVATDSVVTNELTESEVSGLTASLAVEVSCFQITESASLCKNQAEDDVLINNLDAGEQTTPNLIASQDKPLKSSTQKKKSKSNKNRYRRKHKKVDTAVVENNKAEVTVDMGVIENDNGVIVDTGVIENDEGIIVDTGVIENDEGIIEDMDVIENDEGIIVDSGVIENNEGFITEYRRSPPIDLTFKPIQTFGDDNPFGALQTPSVSTPIDYNLSELYKTPVETPEKEDSHEHNKIDKFDTITNTPLSFIVTRSPPNESVVPFDELEPSSELPPFVHPPNANRVISDTELPKSLEIQGSDETISSISPEHVDVNIDCDDKKDAETTNGNSAKIPNDEKQEVSDISEKTTANKTLSNIELDTSEEFLRPEYTINQQKKECELASKLPIDESLKCETNTFKPEDSNICDTLNPIAEEASFDDIKQDAICELAQVSSMPSVPAHPNENDQTIIINEVIQDISVEETNSEMQETSFTNEEIHIDREIEEINHVKQECMETDSETKQHDKDSALKIDESPEAGGDSKQPVHNETSGPVLDHVPTKSDSDIKADTQQMKLELDSQISNSQTTPEELRNIVQGFEVIDKDELIQDNYSSNLPEKVVPPCQDGLKIERKTEEVVNMNSPLYSNLLKMEDDFKADESRSICNTISFHDDNTSNNNYVSTPHSDNSNEVEQLETSEVSSLPEEPQITENISTQSNIMEMEKNTSDPEETEPGKSNPIHSEDLGIADMKSLLSVKGSSSDLAPNTVVETHSFKEEEKGSSSDLAPNSVVETHSFKEEEKDVPLNETTEVTPTTETNLTTLLPSGIQKSKTIEDLSEIVIMSTPTGAEAGDSDGTTESKVEEAQEALELIDETVSVASESPKQPSKPANTPVSKSSATKTTTKPTSGAKTTPTATTGKTPSMKPTASNVTAAKPTSTSAKPSASTVATSKSNTSGVAALKSTAPGSVPSKSATSSAPPSKSTASSATTTTAKSTTTGVAPSKPVASNVVSSKSSASSVPSLKNATTNLTSSKTTAPGTASTKSVAPTAASTKSVAPSAASTKSVAPSAASTKSVTPSTTSTKSVAPSAASTKSVAPSATSTKSVAPSATSTKSVAPSAASTKSVATSAASSKPAAPSSTPAKAPAASTTSSKSTPSSTTAVKSVASSTPAKKPAAASTLKPTTSKTSATSSAKPSVTSSTSVKPVPKPLPVNEITPAAMKSPSKPSTPTSNPTTPTTPKSPLVKMGTAKSPTKPETKFPVLVKTSTSPPTKVKPLDKKPTTTTDAKLPGKKIEAPKPSTTIAGSKTGSSTTKPQTTATNKTTVSKPTTMPATSTKSKPEGPSDKTSNLDGAKKSTSTGVKTAEKVGNESVSAKSTANAKPTPGKPAGNLKTDNKGNTKTGEKTISSKKPEDEKKEAKSAKVQEHKVSTTNNISQPSQAQPVPNVVTESVN